MWIIDRFEGDMAIVESDRIYFNVPIKALPPGCEEGDCLRVETDKETTSRRRNEIEDMMKNIFEKDE